MTRPAMRWPRVQETRVRPDARGSTAGRPAEGGILRDRPGGSIHPGRPGRRQSGIGEHEGTRGVLRNRGGDTEPAPSHGHSSRCPSPAAGHQTITPGGDPQVVAMTSTTTSPSALPGGILERPGLPVRVCLGHGACRGRAERHDGELRRVGASGKPAFHGKPGGSAGSPATPWWMLGLGTLAIGIVGAGTWLGFRLLSKRAERP